MNYTLNTPEENKKSSIKNAVKKMLPLFADEKKNLIIAFIAILVNSGFNLLGPLIVGYTIDRYVSVGDYYGVLIFSGILLAIYIVGFIANYIQMLSMGTVAQRTLFKLRNGLFEKLQSLPVAFFNQNKAGDLISRINNDTDKLNQFFSQSLMQFVGNIFIIIGACIFILVINFRLALAALAPAVVMLIFTQIVSGWVKRQNVISLRAEGLLSSEIQESLGNFKVIVAFNRRDYFEERFKNANQENFKTSVVAGLGNNIFTPLYTFASNIAQLIVLVYGIYLIAHGQFEIGLLISFVLYISRFYDPLRQIASLWSTMQVALAGWDRISSILHLESNLLVIPESASKPLLHAPVISFENVKFGYVPGQHIIHDVSFNLEKGKTYALVGPTGGGKTTTASLIARLYDPTQGVVKLFGKDIRSYSEQERTKRIGFILQEPFIFSGTIRDNIVYGNKEYVTISDEALLKLLKDSGLEILMTRFDQGLGTKIETSGESLSLGQRQLIAFIRAVLRKPDILILDEATANIDTITEQMLDTVLKKLPHDTTRVIIAHRLNTIENADEIFFVNGGTITEAGSMEHAVDMLLHHKRES